MNKIRPTSRDAILEASFQVLNKTPGASLGDIAEHAGVGRATLHRHFSSRDALMAALAKAAMNELNEAIEAAVADATSYGDGLKRALTAIIPLAERQWFLANETTGHDADIAAAYEADKAQLIADIDAAKAEGTFAQSVPTSWIATSYENLIYAAWTMVRAGEATASQAADLAWLTLTSGLGTQELNTEGSGKRK